MVKKTVKRKNVEIVVQEPKEDYQAGGLANLFGKSSQGVTIQEDVVKGDSVIEKPKRRKFEVKKLEEDEKEKDQQENEGEELGKGKKDRTKQRENRTKSKSNSRAIAAENAKTIFVGNMPLTVNEKIVKKIFSEYGDVAAVRMRGLIPKNEKISKRVTHMTGEFSEKQNSLIFYVRFEKEESVEKALKYNGTKLEEHVVRVDKCGGKKEFGKELAVFVGNLPFEIKEDELLAFFAENVGPVDAVRIVRDKNTGQGKGFAFVNFKDDSSASLALSMETIKMDKRDLRITKVMKKGQLNKIENAKKRASGSKKNTNEIKGKLEKFKFSTKKERTVEQTERRALKKSAKKAIKKKKQAKQGRLMQ